MNAAPHKSGFMHFMWELNHVRALLLALCTADIDTHLLPYTMKSIFGLDISKYAGKLVHSIEGMDAFRYLLAFADKYVGVSRDIGTRLNIALSRPTVTGNFDYGTFGLRGRIPTKDFLTYKIWKT